MKVQKQRVATTRDDTPPVIVVQHGSTRRGWDGLLRASARVGVVRSGTFIRDRSRYQTQVLTIAVGHRDDLCADGHELSTRLLATPAAFRADRERDLVACPAFLAGATEDVARHQHQRGVVVERSAATSELAHGLAEERQSFGRNVET